MANSRYEYVKDFEGFDACLPSVYIVVRVDGKGFTSFTRDHGFERPNDTNGLNLMNAAAVGVMREFAGDLVLGFGHSDEYSFVFRKDTALYKRRASKLTSLIVSCFTGHYVHSWSTFFPAMPLRSVPIFDARCVLYPNEKTVRDYLAWRQVDVHVNCQYNTCYWMLYREESDKLSGVDVDKNALRSRVQGMLKGTLTSDKNEIMFQRGVNYNDLPQMWRKGSVCVWENDEGGGGGDGVDSTGVDGAKKKKKKPRRVLRVLHEDIIKNGFWERHPWVLHE